MATATQNWLGVSINFDNVEDKTSESSFDLLLEGFYKAQIKQVNKGVLGDKNRPALIVTFELEDGKKEMTSELYLPEQGDSEQAIKFKNENLRNFFTRTIYSDLTKDEYTKISSEDKNKALKDAQTAKEGTDQFVGKNVLIHIKQEPFIAQDKETKAIKFTELDTATLISKMPKNILKLINQKEEGGVDMSKMPVILFSNKVAGHGFGFYNDFNEETVLKNSKAYEFVQESVLNGGSSTTSTSSEPGAASTKKIPNF